MPIIITLSFLFLGWFGFGQSIAGIVGGLFLSYLADTRRFQHALKPLILVSFIGCLLAIVWFELSVHTFFYDKPILPSTAATIGLSTALAGLFSGGSSPLVYEACAEIMYPLPESLSASILVQWNNVVALILLFIAPNRDKLMNLLVLVVTVICIFMILFARFTYKRRDEDERKRLEKEQDQILSHDSLNPYANGIINEPQYGTFS
jgi:branched-subunit amino acid ABC-type transport system permease component